jgi:hypothetical protein
MRCPHPDWLDNRLTVTGPAADYADFRAAAAGAGDAAWVIDYDRLEEELFLLMMSQARGDALGAPASARPISAAGARHIAREIRELVWRDHEETVSRVGVARGCPFDLNALVPVPWEVLRLGEDDPRAQAWLWEHWGTTWPLRRVEAWPLPPVRAAALPAGWAGCELRFFSADWSPWPVLAECRRRWPALRFDLGVVYAEAGESPPPGRRKGGAPQDAAPL